MAEVEIEAFSALHRLLAAVSNEAVAAADEAAAQVFLAAARSAAPVTSAVHPGHPPGQLQRSVAIVRSANTKMLSSMQGNVAPRIFVGPTKKAGFYGYFVERGWTATGPKRRERAATNTTHSQKGVTGGHKIEGRPWFDPAIQGAQQQAAEAAQAAFDQKLQELDSSG